MEQMFNENVPNLRKVVGNKGYPSVRQTVNIRVKPLF